MKVHEHKLKRQLEGVDKWRRAEVYGGLRNGNGTLLYPTGFGKTYVACIVINSICRKKEGLILIQVPGNALYKQWKAEILHLVEESYRERIVVQVVNTIYNEQHHYDVLLHIADEIHEYLSDKFFTTIDGTLVTSQFMLGLTATWEDYQDRHHKLENICPIVDRITEEEAVENGWISKFVEYNVAVELNEPERETYNYLSDIISEKLPKFNKSLEVAALCTYGGKKQTKDGLIEAKAIYYATHWAIKKGWRSNLNLAVKEDYEIDQLWNPGHIISYGRELFAAIGQRKDILYNASMKLKVAIDILEKFDTMKTICFSQSTAFADKIAETYKEKTKKDDIVVYHTNLQSRTLKDEYGNYITYKTGDKKGQLKIFGKTTLMQEALAKIKTGRARIISTASALDRGLDVKDISLGLITSGKANPTQQKQRTGRVKRIDNYADDVIVLLINLYVPDTRDQAWLENRQKDSGYIVYWVDSIDEINYIPK